MSPHGNSFGTSLDGCCRHLEFCQSGILGTVTLAWLISISVPNLRKISSYMTDIWPKIEIADSGRCHLEFCQKWDIGL